MITHTVIAALLYFKVVVAFVGVVEGFLVHDKQKCDLYQCFSIGIYSTSFLI